MPNIALMRVGPEAVSCGDIVTIEVTVSFAGPPRQGRLVVDIEPPCTFSGQTSSILMRRDGPSPQVYRLTETITCPAGDTFRPRIVATATDDSGTDQDRVRVRVEC
jgi:hypothetical protein